MIDEYVVYNKIYLKDTHKIECAEWYEDDMSWSGHFWVTINSFLDIDYIDRNKFIFLSGDKKFIYWCDVNIFLELHCYRKSQIRELKLNEIFKG